MLFLLFSGYHEQGFNISSLDYLQSKLLYLLNQINYSYSCYRIKNQTQYFSIVNQLKETENEEVLIWYTGHGSSNKNDIYPYISPHRNSFDSKLKYKLINKHGEEIKIKYIFDCCNGANLHLGEILENGIKISKNKKESIKSLIDILAKNEFEFICPRKGIKNYMNKSSTYLNEIILDLILNYEIKNFKEFLSMLSFYFLMRLKNMKNSTIKKTIKYSIDSDIDYNKTLFNSKNLPIKTNNFSIVINKDEYLNLKKNIKELTLEDEEGIEYYEYNINYDEELQEEE
mmetsp:Transcript_19235/g.48870  ORF Transcript_19235/g.48870 Transcript_19235/m.48870 type:complete len:286 (+) Transcript_19235:82-939(+)